VKEILNSQIMIIQPYIEEIEKMKKQEEKMKEEKIQLVKQGNEWIPKETDKEQFKEGYYVFVETFYDEKQFIFTFHPSITGLEIKEKIKELTGRPIEGQTLFVYNKFKTQRFDYIEENKV
jgi:hypothetical protein